MVRFNCMNGWCGRTGITLDGLPQLVIQRCFRTQTCPLCYETKSAALPLPLPPPRLLSSSPPPPPTRPLKRTLVIGGGVRGAKRFKRTHPRLAGYLGNRRPTLLHGMRMKVTTCDRGERTSCAGEDLSADDDSDAGEGAAGMDDDDDDNNGAGADDVGFVDAPVPIAPLFDVHVGAVDDDEAELMAAAASDDSSEAERALEDEGADDELCQLFLREDADDECGDDDDDDDDEMSVAVAAIGVEPAGDQCIVCGTGWRCPLCRQCASNIRKRARTLLKI